MKTVFAAVLSVILILTSFLHAQDSTQQWQAEAVKRYPALGVPGSQFNKRFLEMVNALKDSNPQVFGTTDWPLKIADAVALEINPPAPKPAIPERSAQSVPKIAEALLAGTVSIVTLDRQGKPVAQGSGFLVAPDIVVTNAHVIKGANGVYVIPYDAEKPIAVTSVLKVNTKSDVALLRISQRQKHCLPLRHPTKDAFPEIGSPVYVAGSPKGLIGTFSQGILSGFKEDRDTKQLFYAASLQWVGEC